MVKIYTSQFRYNSNDRYDITVKTGDPDFAPTWDMVMKYKNGSLSEEDYIEMYRQLMLNTYNTKREKWNKILNKDRITFVCYCAANKFCHRKLLAKYFEKTGASYEGEI